MTEHTQYSRFMQLCWTLNDLHLDGLSAALRWVVYRACDLTADGRLERRYYDNMDAAEYMGWIDHRTFGVLAFINQDCELQFTW